jgi:hypothetical protein
MRKNLYKKILELILAGEDKCKEKFKEKVNRSMLADHLLRFFFNVYIGIA